MCIQICFTSSTDSLIFFLFHQCLCRLQLDQIQKCIRITGKYTGSRSAVHGLLTALISFAVMMTVDHGTAQLCTHFIELVTEVRHLIGTVLITSNDLINRVYNDRYIILLCCPSDQLGGKLIHRYRLSSKVPDINILQVVWDIAKGLIYIFKTVKTARPVKLQVHVHHTSLRTMPLQPLLALCYSDTQFYLQERLTSLRRSRDQHLMPFTEHPVNETG